MASPTTRGRTDSDTHTKTVCTPPDANILKTGGGCQEVVLGWYRYLEYERLVVQRIARGVGVPILAIVHMAVLCDKVVIREADDEVVCAWVFGIDRCEGERLPLLIL